MIQGNLFGFRPGQTLIHRPTGRPVELVAIREESIEVKGKGGFLFDEQNHRRVTKNG